MAPSGARPRPAKRRKAAIGVAPDLWPSKGPAALSPELTAAVSEAGGVPVLLPFERERRAVADYLDGVDALVVGGGEPELDEAGGERALLPPRARFEAALLDGAVSRGLPVLAVGGGMQLLDLVLGGALYRDIASELPESHKHVQRRELGKPSHAVNVRARTRLARAVGDGALMVNSDHRRAVRRLGAGLVASAIALDGVIEAYEAEVGRWIVGVQWRPEALLASVPANLGLFRGLIKAASARAA